MHQREYFTLNFYEIFSVEKFPNYGSSAVYQILISS